MLFSRVSSRPSCVFRQFASKSACHQQILISIISCFPTQPIWLQHILQWQNMLRCREFNETQKSSREGGRPKFFQNRSSVYFFFYTVVHVQNICRTQSVRTLKRGENILN